MNSLNSLTLAELRQHDLRADAARARLAAEATRARRRQPQLGWLRRIAAHRAQHVRTPSSGPAAVTPMPRARPFDELASGLSSTEPAGPTDDSAPRRLDTSNAA